MLVAVTVAVVGPEAVKVPMSRVAVAPWPAVTLSIWLSLKVCAAKDEVAKQNVRASPPKAEIIILLTILVSLWTAFVMGVAVAAQ